MHGRDTVAIEGGVSAEAELDFRQAAQPERPKPTLKTAEHIARQFGLTSLLLAWPAAEGAYVCVLWDANGQPCAALRRADDLLTQAIEETK